MHEQLTDAEKGRLKSRIEQVLSEILSDKYECKVALHFEKRRDEECVTTGKHCAARQQRPA